MHFLSDPVCLIGTALGRRQSYPCGLWLKDRQSHLLILGQTGTGKSSLLLNMARQDLAQGTGFCLIDPHGDVATALAPQLRPEDIYWNVADPNCTYGYNPLTHTSSIHRPLIASGLIDALKKQWGDAWGPRMEHLLRYAVLALLETPRADLRDIVRLFVDRPFRAGVIAQITDEQVRAFWTTEYPAMNYQTAFDGVAPIANKLGAFLAHPLVRKALCEPEKPIRFRALMDEGRCLVVNLAKGRLGGDITSVLGGLIVANLFNAGLTRTEQNTRRPFMVFIDEFQTFTTQALSSMLSEIRKYGVGVTVAAQHVLSGERALFEAILGNVGSIACFRVGAFDAPLLSKVLAPRTEHDLQHLPNHELYAALMVDGKRTNPFTVKTWPPNPEGAHG
jgi:Type IV secretion-system coupling protein DNA-binding domain